jgi:glycosyltransferase involved in cell wall biosynthesis
LKVLLIAFYFPPLRAIASVRTGNLAKWLSRSGWEVAVLTPDVSLLRDLENPEKVAAEIGALGIRRINTGHRWRFLSSGFLKRSYGGAGWFFGGFARRLAKRLNIDEMAGWYPEALKACRGITADDFDVILASGNPWGSFNIARRVAKKINRPYVLDYRDPWTAEDRLDKSFAERRAEKKEREALADCAAVTIVSQSWASMLAERFGVGAKVHVLSNGYDPDDFTDVAPRDFGHGAFVYTGIFLPPKRGAEPIMRTLRRLGEIKASDDWRFHYFGPDNDYVRRSAESEGVVHRVVTHGSVPRKQCLEAVAGAKAAMVVTSLFSIQKPADGGMVTGKIFEAMGLKTPLLVIAPHGSDVERIIQTVGNGRAFSAGETDGMARFLADLLDGRSPEIGNPEKYSWPRMIGDLDALLRRVVAEHPAKIQK